LGKRTKQGAINDGINSMLRYYINNNIDPQRQRGIDLVLGVQRSLMMKRYFNYESINEIHDDYAAVAPSKASSNRIQIGNSNKNTSKDIMTDNVARGDIERKMYCINAEMKTISQRRKDTQPRLMSDSKLSTELKDPEPPDLGNKGNSFVQAFENLIEDFLNEVKSITYT
jgi:hypothetical protein